jgi:hypothetical protein
MLDLEAKNWIGGGEQGEENHSQFFTNRGSEETCTNLYFKPFSKSLGEPRNCYKTPQDGISR